MMYTVEEVEKSQDSSHNIEVLLLFKKVVGLQAPSSSFRSSLLWHPRRSFFPTVVCSLLSFHGFMGREIILGESFFFQHALPVHAKEFSCTGGMVKEFSLNSSEFLCIQFYCKAFPSIWTIFFAILPFCIFFFVIPPEFRWKKIYWFCLLMPSRTINSYFLPSSWQCLIFLWPFLLYIFFYWQYWMGWAVIQTAIKSLKPWFRQRHSLAFSILMELLHFNYVFKLLQFLQFNFLWWWDSLTQRRHW